MWILTDVGDCFRGGGIENKELVAISKKIWYYLFKKNMIIFEYLPVSINTAWDRGFRQTRNPSEWKLNSNIFKKLCQIRGTQEKWICLHQECQTNYPHTCHWKSILLVRVNMLPRCPRLRFVYAFALTGRVLQRLIQDQCSMLIITPVWPGQPWFPVRLKMPVKTPILQLVFEDLRRDPAEKVNSHVMQNSFQLFLFLDNLRKNLLAEGRPFNLITDSTWTCSCSIKVTSQLGKSSVISYYNWCKWYTRIFCRIIFLLQKFYIGFLSPPPVDSPHIP